MSERPPSREAAPERIPTEEEILGAFTELVKGESWKEDIKLSDGKGVYAWEIVVSGQGGRTEYCYARKGSYGPQRESSATVVQEVRHDSSGIPVSGDTKAEYVDGKWRYF